MAYYLGIDGGGSKTICVLGDEQTILASALAGPSNITRIGEARARESIQEAIRRTCAAAGIKPEEVKRACIGAAGAGREEIAGAVHRFAAEIIPGKVEVVGDMAIALQAAFGAGPGVMVIAGTGSIAYGRDAQGKTARAGGWGFAISDEGSAHWIGRQAVSAFLRAADERLAGKNESPLLQHIEAAWSADSIAHLAQIANAGADFAKLFPAVLAAADAGDPIAQQILEHAANELARLANIVVCQCFPAASRPASVAIAMAGGVFRHGNRIRDSFSDLILSSCPNVALRSEVVEPVHGALQMARGADHSLRKSFL